MPSLFINKPPESAAGGAAEKVRPVAWTLLGLAVFYIAFFQSYRAYEIDNPWYLSFSHAFWVDHYGGDRFLGGVFPDGMGGTVVFGRIPALIQGLFLNPVGWSPLAAVVLSTALVITGLAFWYVFMRRSGWSQSASLATIVALGLSEPFVGMADRFRYEPFAFCLMALAFWLLARRCLLPALVAGMLAVEVEPAALIVCFATVLLAFRLGFRVSAIVKGLLVAGLVFALVYGLLHRDVLEILRHTDWHRGSDQRTAGGFLRAYFVSRRRHLAELVPLLLCVLLLLRRYRSLPPAVHRMVEITGLVTLFSFAMRWPTPGYMAFWYPPALTAALGCVLAVRWSSLVLPGVTAVLMLPQYAALAWMNRHDGWRPQDLQQVRTAIGRAEAIDQLDPRSVQIFGDYSLWFAHPEGYRGLARPNLPYLEQGGVYLCFDTSLQSMALIDPIGRYCGDLTLNHLRLHEVEQLTLRGHTLHVLVHEHDGLKRDGPE